MEKILFIVVLLIWLLVPVLAVAVVLTIFKQVKSRKDLFGNQEFTDRFMLFIALLMFLISVLVIFCLLNSPIISEAF